MPGMRAFGCHQTGSANQDSEFQVRNLKSFHCGRPAICWLLPATPKVVPVDSLAERTELTPSRLFSSARRNCSRDGSYRQLPADGLQITPQCRSQPRWSRPLSPTTFVIVTNQKCQLYPCEVYHGLSAGMGRAALMTGCTTKDLCAASFRKPLVDNYLHSDTAHNTACGKRLVRMAVPRTAAPST